MTALRGASVARAPARGRPGASHRFLAHTADAGFAVEARSLAGLLEESAAALAELSSDRVARPAGEPAGAEETLVEEIVSLDAPDLASLVVAWLNELIGLGEVHRAAIDETRVESAAVRPAPRVSAVVRLTPYASGRARPRVGVKSATYHRLAVGRTDRAWHLTVYLDV